MDPAAQFLITQGALGVVVGLFITGQLQTKGTLDREIARGDRSMNVSENLVGVVRTLTDEVKTLTGEVKRLGGRS